MVNETTTNQGIPAFEVAQAANIIEYGCGCKASYQLIGVFAEKKEFHIIPCFLHQPAFLQNKLQRQVETDWERITSEVRS